MWCAFYLLILVVSGYAISASLARNASKLEIAALTLCMGPALMGFCLIILSLLGQTPGRNEILIVAALLAIFAAIVWRMPRPAPGPRLRQQAAPSWWIGVCTLAIAYGFFSIAIDALMYPTIEWDAFAIWQLKAKVLAIYALHPRPAYFSNLSLSYSHLRYPLLVPMVSAGMHAMTGRFDDCAKTIALLLYPGMCLAVFAVVRRINGTSAAFGATALLAVTQPILRYGGSGTAEMGITAFYAASLVCMVRWRETRERNWMILAALFSAWMAWTKNEGLALAAVNAIVIAVSGPRAKRRNALASAAVFAAIVAVIYLPWIIFSWGLPRTDEDYAGRLASLQLLTNSRRLGQVFIGYGKEFLRWRDWGLFWGIVVLLSLTERRRFKNPLVAMIGILLILHILAYVPPFVVTNWKLDELLSVTTDRLLMHVAPAGAILIGLLWPSWAGGAIQRAD
jgi:hypothetical protein